MANKKRLIGISIISILAILIFSYWYRPYSRFLLLVFPPSDLYAPLIEVPISLQKQISFNEFQIKHKYVGVYTYGVKISQPPKYGVPINSNSELNLKITDNSKLVFNETASRWASRFGGPGKKESGVVLGFYKVPSDVPLEVDLQATLAVVKNDAGFEGSYGKIKFYIRRTGDY